MPLVTTLSYVNLLQVGAVAQIKEEMARWDNQRRIAEARGLELIWGSQWAAKQKAACPKYNFIVSKA